MTMTIDGFVLKRLAKGPVYARSFHAVKPVVERLIAAGKIERCAPEGGRMKNMLRLKESGHG